MTTFEKKIVELHDHVQKEFLTGCEGIRCEDCPLWAEDDVIEEWLCEMMRRIPMSK